LVPLDAARNLEQVLAGMRWEVLEGDFCLLGFEEPAAAADLALLAGEPGQLVREGGETTLLVRAEHAEDVLARHPGARAERDLVWIRFRMAMDWELVGFLALVTGRLAEAGVPVGAVCGFSRDHLFVARPHLERARGVLEALFPGRGGAVRG
jgi:hypothetical protein